MRYRAQKGFAVLEIVLIVLAVAGIVAAGLVVTHRKSGAKSPKEASKLSSSQAVQDTPLPLKSIGFNLDFYNPATNLAGDMEFTNVDHTLSGHNHQIWQDFGTHDPRTADTTKKNPQPTFVLPLHTKVHALVSGQIVDVKKLYSNDYTVWTARFPSSHYIYETEHVDNPLVKVGDKVTGGQVIAEVSDKDSEITPGFGLLEIGILYTGKNSPQHLCPFQYLAPSIKDDVGKKITALHSSWEAYYGQRVYFQDFVTPGCVSLDPVNG